MNFVPVSKIIIFCILNFCVMFVQGAEIEIPHTFKDGEVTSAKKMNDNFIAIKKAINELNGDEISVASSRFIGFSNDWIGGSDGLFELQRACQEFSSESHVCSAQELTRSEYSDAMESIRDGAQAWVRGSLTLVGIKADAKTTENALGCKGWQDETADGLVVDSDGGFSSHDCKNVLPVACCQ
jgi:hypothetical protein